MRPTPSRGRIKRKWAVDKNGGPQLFAAELVMKKLIQHCWPCQIVDYGHTCVFKAARFHQLGPDFDQALELALRIVSQKYRFKYTIYNRGFRLVGEYTLSEKGVLKCANSDSISATAVNQ